MNLPVIDLPRTINSWRVSYNNQLGLIETEAVNRAKINFER